jgi:phenylalanyl-tRNA synthetase alpha chain
VTLDDYSQQVASLVSDAEARIPAAESAAQLEELRADFIGRSRGRINQFSKALGSLAPEDRARAGGEFKAAKERIETLLAQRTAALSAGSSEHASRPADLTMPSRQQWRGTKHPVTQVIEEVDAIFRALGFTVALGPEAETEWYNFGSLNFPADHPAMDMHDTLYLSDDVLLRTHTSPVQVRTLQRFAPPIRVLVPGNVYRRDFFDPSHAPMFAQIEGLCVDEGVSFVDLKATLTHFAKKFYGDRPVRFRPSFFPFTEPSAELDIQCGTCNGSGCPVCKQTGWVEILGSGMVHPHVLESAGIDSERYTGWAFGMGPARVAMARWGLPDIRLLYDSDVRFLEQLAR